MILPLFLHPPPPQPLSLSSLWPLDAFLLVNAHVSSDISAASIQRFLNTEARCRSQALLIPSGTLRSRVFAHPVTPSVRCSPDMAHSNKRLCKALELSNCRSKVLVSDCNHTFDPRFRVSAFTRHGRPGPSGTELEQTDDDDDDDASQLQVRCSNAKKKASGKMKSAKELHFEAIEGYCLRYENEDNSCYGGSSVGFEADAAPLEDMHGPVCVRKATPDNDVVNTPVNESKYLDAPGVLPWISDGGFSLSQSNGCKEKTMLQKNISFEIEELRMPVKVSQSMQTANINGTDRPINAHVNTGNARTTEVSQDEGSTPKIMRKKTVRACNSDNSQHRNKLDEEEAVQTQNCTELKSKVESTHFDEIGDLSEEQKIRMELNKAAALARRHMRSCEGAVGEAQVKGLPFPKFESLLVEKSWAEALRSEFQKPYMERLHQFVNQEAAGRIPIYPPPAKLFNAFNSCPLDKVKVVIIGQDPYHGPGQAMGLCFSVESGIKLPSSLTNIFLEIQSDLDCDFPSHGNLEKWAHQGVLLLNTVLTVRDRHANSHAKKGWELFTDAAIRTLVQQRSSVVFLLWGNQAQEKLRLINKTSHHILKAFHPSGISAHKGFFKCRHFSRTNQLLVDEGLLPIDWQL